MTNVTALTNSLSNPLPLILGLGVPKAATTWIHRQLEAHPEISTTTTKEVGYWSRHYDKGPYWYRDQFAVKPGSRIFAEFTPHYMNRDSLSRIARDLDNPKFIMSIRNPYHRAYSGYLHGVRNGDITSRFEDACRGNIIWDSLYGNKLTMYLEHFSLDQLLIVEMEAIERDPFEAVKKLYAFCGVSEYVPDGLTKRVNVGRDKSATDRALKRLERTAKRFGVRREHLKRLGLDRAIEAVQGRLARKKPKPKAPDMQFLVDQLQPDIEVFSRLTGRDYHWSP